ncbi:BQ5605_C008g05155 [Microbotryum silenes-dioicae]|uniref:BQ5605_C008g05155 protein n=1 Tax=Microbotryum silenes-dioicae TaxID=796604 RepID=A0A2X0MZ97_9BASI|nr:BQ5605_C008g05155 [Microbotryum silenes-dioicae]
MLALISLLALISGACALPNAQAAVPAALQSNLAYRSPSLNVRALEIDTGAVFSRKRWANTFSGNLSFPFGVASGDPYSDSAVLWTMPRKVDPEGLYGGNAYPPICLLWVVAPTNSSFKIEDSVQHGYVQTTIDIDFSVKVIADNLKPYTKYYYRFESCEDEPDLGVSPVGSFKTLPAENADVEKLRLAVFSCANYPFGFFNAYGAAASNSDRLDYVQHIGDYIYEYANGAYGDGTALNRIPQPLRECSSLQDYRDRYATYRSDPDLQKLHQLLAWQTVWDDHEVADNTWAHGSADSNDTVQGQIGLNQFSARKANAVRAYFEWMPIRQVETDDKLRIWRTFKLGKLATMIMLDTRQYDRSLTDLYYNTKQVAAVADSSSRSMTGSKQQAWFFDQLKQHQERKATWPLIMQQVVFSRVNYTISTEGSTDFNFDAWEGYRYQREQILQFIKKQKIENTVVLSGDSHASWVFDLVETNSTTYNPATGEGALGVEFAGSAVSSPSSYGHGPSFTDEVYKGIAKGLTLASPSLLYAEGKLRGYFELLVTPKAVQAHYYGFVDQATRNYNVTEMGVFETLLGANRITRPVNSGTVPVYGALGAHL